MARSDASRAELAILLLLLVSASTYLAYTASPVPIQEKRGARGVEGYIFAAEQCIKAAENPLKEISEKKGALFMAFFWKKNESHRDSLILLATSSTVLLPERIILLADRIPLAEYAPVGVVEKSGKKLFVYKPTGEKKVVIPSKTTPTPLCPSRPLREIGLAFKKDTTTVIEVEHRAPRRLSEESCFWIAGYYTNSSGLISLLGLPRESIGLLYAELKEYGKAEKPQRISVSLCSSSNRVKSYTIVSLSEPGSRNLVIEGLRVKLEPSDEMLLVYSYSSGRFLLVPIPSCAWALSVKLVYENHS